MPTRTGIVYAPRPSVTASNVLPVASSTAVTVTPGSTAPVVSLTVPVNTASCAYPMPGSARMAQTRRNRLMPAIEVLLLSFKHEQGRTSRACRGTLWIIGPSMSASTDDVTIQKRTIDDKQGAGSTTVRSDVATDDRPTTRHRPARCGWGLSFVMAMLW